MPYCNLTSLPSVGLSSMEPDLLLSRKHHIGAHAKHLGRRQLGRYSCRSGRRGDNRRNVPCQREVVVSSSSNVGIYSGSGI